MGSIHEEIEKSLDRMLEIAHKSINENIPPKNNSFGEEWDSLINSVLELAEKDSDLNGLLDCLTQVDIETYDDEEFEPYHKFIPKYKSIVYKFMDVMILAAEEEQFQNRNKTILEEIKRIYE